MASNKKSFSAPKKMSVAKSGKCHKGSGGFSGRVTQPNVKPNKSKTNP